MTKEEYVKCLQMVDSQQLELSKAKIKLRKEFIKNHAEFSHGDKVVVTNRHTGNEIVCFIDRVFVDGNYEIVYKFRKATKKGNMHKTATIYISYNSIKKYKEL